MPNLKDAWFADRAKGMSRPVLSNTGTGNPTILFPGSGPTGIPSTGNPPSPVTNPPVLNPTTPLPQPGGPIVAGAPEMVGVGFTGTEYIHSYLGVAAGVSAASLSVWLDYNSLLPGISPDPLAGTIFAANGNGLNADQACLWGVTPTFVTMSELETITYPTLIIGAAQQAGCLLGASYPSHWAHLMVSVKSIDTFTISPFVEVITSYQVVAYLNDIALVNTIIYTDPNFSNTTQLALIDGTDTASDPLYIGRGSGYLSDPSISAYLTKANGYLIAGMAELWVRLGTFIDWSVKDNRELFHVTNGSTYMPCDLGKTGARPLGFSPTIYCSGDHTNFPYNRATGNLLGTVVGTLIDVKDGFG